MSAGQFDFLSQGADLKVRKLLARSYLRDNRLDEAMEVYLGILAEFPHDVDVRVVFANLYQAAGCPEAAQAVIRLGENGAGENHNLALLSRDAAADLRDRLRNTGAAFQNAADLLEQRALEQPKTGQYESLQQLLPALIEQNIRQARAEGRADLAEALQSLQINLTRQVFREES